MLLFFISFVSGSRCCYCFFFIFYYSLVGFKRRKIYIYLYLYKRAASLRFNSGSRPDNVRNGVQSVFFRFFKCECVWGAGGVGLTERRRDETTTKKQNRAHEGGIGLNKKKIAAVALDRSFGNVVF